jgi:hypothetical protein
VSAIDPVSADVHGSHGRVAMAMRHPGCTHTDLIRGNEQEVEELPCDGVGQRPCLAQHRPSVVLLATVPALAPA